MSNLGTVFLEYEEVYRQKVLGNTWGHLAPEPRRVYRGEILFAHGDYGCISPIRCEFKGLPDSPWFYQHMVDFIGNEIMARDESGSIYRFVGTYRRLKNGSGKFTGTVSKVDI